MTILFHKNTDQPAGFGATKKNQTKIHAENDDES